MGMSASQARLLSLQARQSNLEYQGQQINQERTILSQQCTALYNSLLAMSVPTPPSTSDFTTVKYTGENGATTYSFDASSVKPGSDGTYCLTLGTTEYGASLNKNNGYVTTQEGTEKVSGSVVTSGTYTTSGEATEVHLGYEASTAEPAEGERFMKKVPGANYEVGQKVYIKDGNQFTQVEMTEEMKAGDVYTLATSGYDAANGDSAIGNEITTTVPGTPTAKLIAKDALSKFFVIEGDYIRKSTEDDFIQVNTNPAEYELKDGVQYLYKDGTTTSTYSFEPADDQNQVLIAGKTPYTLSDALAKGVINETEYQGYVNAINNAALKSSTAGGSTDYYGPEDFYLYVDDNQNIHFALISDVNDGSGAAVTYDYTSNGEYTKNTEYDYTQLEFDPSSGRITSITLPTTYDADGKPLTYTTIDVQAETETDTVAYEDAYAQYEYEQYLYDKKQQEINAKTSIIQAEDRNLELKLQRLDNERTQITTEIEAVQKVIDENIESSYKTFSG